MKLNQQSTSAIEWAIKKAVKPFTQNSIQPIVTDIHLQPNQNSGEFYIFDDEDKELAHTTVDEWANYDGDDFYEEIEGKFQFILGKLKEEGIFDHLTILKPYSFVLVDEEKETISDLLLIDDDTMFINDELLKGLDEELDSFLKDLLEQ